MNFSKLLKNNLKFKNKIMVKLKELINSKKVLDEFAKEKMPLMLSYKIAKVIIAVNKEHEPYVKVLNSLLEEFGTKIMVVDEKTKKEKWGGNYDLGDNVKKFNDSINELLEQDVEIAFPEIKLSDFKDINEKDMNLSPFVLSKLSWLIKE